MNGIIVFDRRTGRQTFQIFIIKVHPFFLIIPINQITLRQINSIQLFMSILQSFNI